jgi:hypothetical protein
MDSYDLSNYSVLIVIFISNKPLATYRTSAATDSNCVLLEAASVAFFFVTSIMTSNISALDRLHTLPTTKFAQPWIIAYGAK